MGIASGRAGRAAAAATGASRRAVGIRAVGRDDAARPIMPEAAGKIGGRRGGGMTAEVITDSRPTVAAEASDPAGGKPVMRAPDRAGTTGAPIAAAGTIAARAASGGAKAGNETGVIAVAASDRGSLDV
jgi:hypothetical protein